MPSAAFTDLMPQTATYWAPGIADGQGGVSFQATPVQIACRWQNKTALYRNAAGDQAVSEAVVYTDRALLAKGWLYLGTSATPNPKNVAGAREIKSVQASPSLDAVEELHKVLL